MQWLELSRQSKVSCLSLPAKLLQHAAPPQPRQTRCHPGTPPASDVPARLPCAGQAAPAPACVPKGSPPGRIELNQPDPAVTIALRECVLT